MWDMNGAMRWLKEPSPREKTQSAGGDGEPGSCEGDGRCYRMVNSLILNTLGQDETLGDLCPSADGLVR